MLQPLTGVGAVTKKTHQRLLEMLELVSRQPSAIENDEGSSASLSLFACPSVMLAQEGLETE